MCDFINYDEAFELKKLGFNEHVFATFFEMFEKYRDERHLAYINSKEEAHAQFKAMGDSNRIS